MGSNGMASSPFFYPNFMLQMQIPHEDEEHFTNPQPFIGAAAMLGRRKRSMSFSGIEPCEEDELSDDCSQAGGEKKRRLGAEQVRALERNFEQGNKLDPERKMQLARALGLQPRQIAIWFQNRRARWKTKQLERDYELLKQQFDAIKADNDALQSQNKKLQAEMLGLRGRESSEPINLNKETVEGSSEENSSEVNVEGSIHHPQQSIPFFTSLRPPPSMAQFLHASSRSELRCPKIDSMVTDENFSNLLCSVEDQSAFWPWPDHHAFH